MRANPVAGDGIATGDKAPYCSGGVAVVGRPTERAVGKRPHDLLKLGLLFAQGGQRVDLLPQHDLVVVFTGDDCTAGDSPPNRIMAAIILPALLAATEGRGSAPRTHSR